jgi:hypothetical protein
MKYQSNYPRKDFDAYETVDPRVVDWLADRFELSGFRVLEPFAGDGALAARLEHHGAIVMRQDIKTGSDFLRSHWRKPTYDAVITNPPYDPPEGLPRTPENKGARLYLRHALIQFPEADIVFFMPGDWSHAEASRPYLENPRFAFKSELTFRPIFFGKGGGTQNFAWFGWRPRRLAGEDLPRLLL